MSNPLGIKREGVDSATIENEPSVGFGFRPLKSAKHAASMAEMRGEFTFFSLAIPFVYGPFDDQVFPLFFQHYGQEVPIYVAELSKTIMRVPHDPVWEHTLLAIENPHWPSWKTFLVALKVHEPDMGDRITGIGAQEVQVPDPFARFFGWAEIVSFGINASDRTVYLDPRTLQIRMDHPLKSAEVFAASLWAGNNPQNAFYDASLGVSHAVPSGDSESAEAEV